MSESCILCHPWLPLDSTCVCVSFLRPPDPSDVYTVVLVVLRDPIATVASESAAAAERDAANPTAREAISLGCGGGGGVGAVVLRAAVGGGRRPQGTLQERKHFAVKT